MVFLKEFFEKVDLEKNQHMTKIMQNYPVGKELRFHGSLCHYVILFLLKEILEEGESTEVQDIATSPWFQKMKVG